MAAAARRFHSQGKKELTDLVRLCLFSPTPDPTRPPARLHAVAFLRLLPSLLLPSSPRPLRPHPVSTTAAPDDDDAPLSSALGGLLLSPDLAQPPAPSTTAARPSGLPSSSSSGDPSAPSDSPWPDYSMQPAAAPAQALQPTSSAHPAKAPYRPPQQQQQQPFRSAHAADERGYHHASASGARPSGGSLGRLPSFGQQGGYRPDLNRRPSARVNGGSASNGGVGGGGGAFMGPSLQQQQRSSVGNSAMYYGGGGGGEGGYPQGLPYGAGAGGWYPPAQGLRYSPPEGSTLSQDGSGFAPSGLPSPARSTSVSPATSQHVSFPYNPYAAPNPYSMSVSPHGYFVPPPGVMYPPSGPPSSIDSISQPSSPAPGSSSTSSSSPRTVQGHNGQTWVYVPVSMTGYYVRPPFLPRSRRPLERKARS